MFVGQAFEGPPPEWRKDLEECKYHLVMARADETLLEYLEAHPGTLAAVEARNVLRYSSLVVAVPCSVNPERVLTCTLQICGASTAWFARRRLPVHRPEAGECVCYGPPLGPR